jgi:transposase-like protein
MNLIDLSNTVHDKAASVHFLQQRGILHNPRICENGHPMVLQLRDKGDRWRCHSRECRTEVPLRKGTWMESSKLKFREVILFIYSWSREMTSMKFVEHELGIGHTTAVDYNNFLREVCAADLLRNPVQIGGPGTTVEVDESLFARRKNHQGRAMPQQWVFGGWCRATRESFMFAVPDRSAATLLPIIQGSILPGTTIMSDLWRAYGGITAMGYTHFTVNHSINFIDPQTGAHTQNVERSWKSAKERNKRHNGTHRQMLDSYLCEWMWRQRHRQLNLFDKILADIVVYWPPN